MRQVEQVELGRQVGTAERCSALPPLTTKARGGASMAGLDPTLLARFWAKVDKRGPDECWEWTAGTGHRYGSFRLPLIGTKRAHRVSWEIANGPIPNGLCVLHRCDNPPCVNPAHLFVGTQGENLADASAKKRLKGRPKAATDNQCPHGHLISGHNRYINWSGHRECRECRNAQARVYKQRVKARALAALSSPSREAE